MSTTTTARSPRRTSLRTPGRTARRAGFVTAATALAVLGVAGTALAAPDEYVSPDDAIMSCGGDKALVQCEVTDFDVKSQEVVTLPPVRVTEQVAGCTSGNQPSISRAISYTRSTTVDVSGGVSLGNLPGAGNAFGPLKDAVSVSAGVSVSETTGYGDTQTYTVPADYGKVSYGQFAQRAVRATGDLFVRTEDSGEFPASYSYGAHGVVITTPLQRDEKKLPEGTLSTRSRDFATLGEFRTLCGYTATPPPYLR